MNLFENNYKSDVIKISIVMPVHNTPEYALRESLDSILAQEFTRFEVICIDDGSSVKETIETLNEYKIKDNRVQVIRLDESIGCGGARNVGIKMIRGKYTIFLDSDDYFAPHYLKKLYELIEFENTDVCITGFSIFNETNNGKEIIKAHSMDRNYESYVKDADFLIEATVSACNKLVKSEYLIEVNAKFLTTNTDDDVYYGLIILLCTDRFSLLDDTEGFYYRFNTNYQMSSKMNPLDLWIGINEVNKELSIKGMLSESNIQMIDTYLINTGIMEMNNCSNQGDTISFYKLVSDYLKHSDTNFNTRTHLYRKYWITQSYESKWFETIGDYYKQLDSKKNEILALFENVRKPIVIWGIGKRGQAFERFAKDNGMEIRAVCDSKNKGCGKQDDYGNIILNTEEVVALDDISVVTSNDAIAKELDDVYGMNTISIEHFCDL